MRDRTRTPYPSALDRAQGSPSTANESLAGQGEEGRVPDDQEQPLRKVAVAFTLAAGLSNTFPGPWILISICNGS